MRLKPVFMLGLSLMMYSKDVMASEYWPICKNTTPMFCMILILYNKRTLRVEKSHQITQDLHKLNGAKQLCSSHNTCIYKYWPHSIVGIWDLIQSHAVKFDCLCVVLLLEIDICHVHFQSSYSRVGSYTKPDIRNTLIEEWIWDILKHIWNSLTGITEHLVLHNDLVSVQGLSVHVIIGILVC